ncbi:hypothetical protein VCHA53O466_40408 [Vibrio chagasii]|nr:hypothetical protein VCHA53O466_40408 [Vibrio chagasii]
MHRKYHGLLVFLAIVLISSTTIYMLGRERVNPTVYIEELKAGETDYYFAPVTYSPHLDPFALGQNMKLTLNEILSYDISDPVGHITSASHKFTPTYSSEMIGYFSSAINSLRKQNVRVVDFIVTTDPVYIGSERSTRENWNYFVQGYFNYQGLFSGRTSISEPVRLFIKVERGRATSDNPLGVGIYKIHGLPDF